MRFACGVVLYNPTDNNLEYLVKLSEGFEQLLVFDNSKSNVRDYFKNSVYLSTGQNEGLAVPYNRFIEYCEKNEIDFLCLLDQDTLMSIENVYEIRDYIEKHYDAQTGIYSPTLKNFKAKKWVINSNSFLNIHVLSVNNLQYDENYFIDKLDADFCRRIGDKGINIEVINDIGIAHRIGEGKKGEHNALRHYYIFKSRLYYNHKFYKGFQKFFRNVLQIIRHFLIIMGEDDSIAKIRACYRAWIDYSKGKYGKICGGL